MQGFVDSVTETFVAGWAFHSFDTAPVLIEVVIDGAVVATSVTDRPRPDIERGYGRTLAGFYAALDLPEAVRANFALGRVRVYAISDHKRYPMPQAYDPRREPAIEIDDTGSAFWMYGENLFRGLAVDLGEGADEIVAVAGDGLGNCMLTLQSRRSATVAADAKVPVVPERFANPGNTDG